MRKLGTAANWESRNDKMFSLLTKYVLRRSGKELFVWLIIWEMPPLSRIFLWRCGPTRAMASSFVRFLDHTQRRNTVGRTPLEEWSARRRDLYLTTQNTHNRHTSMLPVGFEPTVLAGEGPQTYALDRAATGTDRFLRLANSVHRPDIRDDQILRGIHRAL